MNMHERFVAPEVMMSRAGTPLLPAWLLLLWVRLAQWATTCIDHYAAAAAYEELSCLSDLELKHRALTRDILIRDLSVWRNRVSGDWYAR